MNDNKGKLALVDNYCGHCEDDNHPVIDLMLEIDEGGGNSLTRLIAEIDEGPDDNPIIASRIVACWNACEGMPIEEINSLISAKRLLDALKLAGVDNWDGWDLAHEILEEI